MLAAAASTVASSRRIGVRPRSLLVVRVCGAHQSWRLRERGRTKHEYQGLTRRGPRAEGRRQVREETVRRHVLREGRRRASGRARAGWGRTAYREDFFSLTRRRDEHRASGGLAGRVERAGSVGGRQPAFGGFPRFARDCRLAGARDLGSAPAKPTLLNEALDQANVPSSSERASCASSEAARLGAWSRQARRGPRRWSAPCCAADVRADVGGTSCGGAACVACAVLRLHRRRRSRGAPSS
jgi:hypothetical protein